MKETDILGVIEGAAKARPTTAGKRAA